MSDSSSDILTSDSEEENKHKKIRLDDRATSKFYTKDENHEDLPYVADNVVKKHKTKLKKKKRKKKSSHSNGSLKVDFFLNNLY